ncbi:redox-sensitive transcriptional activator SoxR [Arthrobacter psychrochitiniphilus]|uniref:Redox-sensitive transcriptional activator SoxR n=1 Tax=Arthrobacter psychrochitiniphilus TaxID=291045 RepID=A0A2V3DPP6_9MICC|nr:redox-sensitive transcriptional activator SoxR [Arthrobacter psychrochitiniphilus]NYG18276.1 MerR family redox-sensitive transcriptional activator SoxR [Arthrobacter psychrochitiniphilus]PXA64933.1 redox-sensitive transcriptional activator SoxR [Arthrobacter psychrochitiniphilus]
MSDAGASLRAQEQLSVGQVAQRGDVSVSALHFYERQGLIFSSRTSGNQRRYPRSVLRRVAVIRAAQRAGIPLSLVRGVFAELPDHGVPTQQDWQRLSEHWQSELDARIAALQKLRGSLGGCIGCGCLSLAECGFVNPDDQVADLGPGARVFDGIDRDE